MTKAALSLIQTGLRDLGHYSGAIDGVWGPKSQAALSAFTSAELAPVGAVANSAAATIYQGAARYPVHEIVVHCSATTPGWLADRSLSEQREEIRRWHVRDRGWRDIGYHWLIGRDGQILPGRAEAEIGSGVLGHNRGVIHFCLIGGLGSSETDRAEQHFTGRQLIALRQQIQAVSMRTPIRRISGHNEHAAKACPGFNVPKFLKEVA